MGIVIRFASFNKKPPTVPTGLASATFHRGKAEFTLRDRADLDEWSAGNRPVSLCSSEMGTFAMLYQEGMRWASWGVVRQGRKILLWDCVTLADIGRFRSMFDALAAIPDTGLPVPMPSVLLFTVPQSQHAAVR